MEVLNLPTLFFFIVFMQIGVSQCEDTNELLLQTIENHERMLQHLSQVVTKQSRQIAELKKNCIFETTKKTIVPSEKNMDRENADSPDVNFSKLATSMVESDRNLTTKPGNHVRRLLLGSTPSTEPLNSIGFYSYLGTHDNTPAANKVIVFDTVKVNAGNAYNKYSGVFTAPESGLYAFSWTIECDGGGKVFTHAVRNTEILGSLATDSGQESEYRMSTGLVLVLANKGDTVFVRVHTVYSSRIHSSDFARSSFSGWKIN